MKKIANVIACVFTAVSLYAFFTARTFPPGSNGALGPGFFPQVLAVLVIFLSVLELVGSRNAVIPENQREVTLFRKENLKVWLSVAAVIVYIWIIHQLIKENHILLFCPSITMMHRLKATLQEALPRYEITDVSSRDNQRAEKVQKMREAKYDILLTTMILERGVTFERISVIVLGADHPVFTKSSLVQIAGRADRKGPYTNSQVYFFYEEKTAAIRKACQEIKEMNEEGKKIL